MQRKNTHAVDDDVFKAVYDTPASLPGRYRWLTRDEDVRQIEKLLGMPAKSIGAPLWVSGDRRNCKRCKREINWLDIVASSLRGVHSREMIARVVLGQQKFVNTEAPRAIAGVTCSNCQTPFPALRSFKCHNWAYAEPELLEVLQSMKVKGARR